MVSLFETIVIELQKCYYILDRLIPKGTSVSRRINTTAQWFFDGFENPIHPQHAKKENVPGKHLVPTHDRFHAYHLRCSWSRRSNCRHDSQVVWQKVSTISPAKQLTISIIVPAFNEAAGIADTLTSLLSQTRKADRIIVVNDCSTDTTEEIALTFADRGVEVLTPPHNLGSKAKAQNYALESISDTDLVLPIDGDTVLEPTYIEKLVPVFSDPLVSVAAGCVLTQRQETIWEKARQLEYLFGFHWYRTIQQMASSPTVCSGCCTVFRRHWIVEAGGFPETTLTEDIFYTWGQYIEGRKAVYVHDAVARAAEPISLKYMSTQLKRWKCGWFHGFRLQWPKLVRHKPMVALWSGLQFLETTLAPIVMLLPLLAVLLFGIPVWQTFAWWLLGDLITFWPPVIYGCIKRGYPIRKALLSYHTWYALKLVNFRWDVHMLVREMILVPLGICKPWTTYERGKA